jgi:superfamily II DNA/RNA helicase
MDAFITHTKVVDVYREYLKSFLFIADPRVRQEVLDSLQTSGFIPKPLIQFNPSFQKGETISELAESLPIDTRLESVFGSYNLYKHQVEAMKVGVGGRGFVVTSGTGSGKSLTFLATIFNKLLMAGAGKKKGVKAILVYPMNALINSQEEEIKKFEANYGNGFPITYAKYTGQEKQDDRDAVKQQEPDIILTNYMMLELIMTRQSEDWMRESLSKNLEYLVFDELHTYRGRQGSDVSMLVRRIRSLCKNEIICIGTSATMASAGTPLEKKKAVAEVATRIFGKHYDPDQIIPEYLETCTNGNIPKSSELSSSVRKGIDKNADGQTFVAHPLANWLELAIALKTNEDLLERGTPCSIDEMAVKLSELTEINKDELVGTIVDLLQWTETLNEANRKAGTRMRFLPFRFHQFISQTGTASVTLQPRSSRTITVQPGRYVVDEEGEKLLYPLLFSRFSGVDFICVTKDTETKLYKPRNPFDFENLKKMSEMEGDVEEDNRDGYIVLDEGESFWNENIMEIVPEEWLKKNGTELKKEYVGFMPQPVYFNSKGAYSTDSIYPTKGYYIPAKLRIDPTAGVIYQDSKTNESTKLMGLGSEGRSTATTIMSYAVIESLHQQQEPLKDQKLMSFTDNRQDASLQSGHFNDFIATIRLRAAIQSALETHPGGLNCITLPERVFESLKLSETEYAMHPCTNPKYPDVENEKALKAYLLYRIFEDLKRGWRYTVPNLEQTALLRIDYKSLDQMASDDELFADMPFMVALKSDQRHELLKQFLDYFRYKYALHHPILSESRSETESLLKTKLDAKKLWSLDKNEQIQAPTYLVKRKPGQPSQRGVYYTSMGMQSGIGRYFLRKMREWGHGSMSRDEFADFIEALCTKMVSTNMLVKKENLPGTTGRVDGFLLRADAINWYPGDRQNVEIDRTMINAYRGLQITPNMYFQKLYLTDFSKYQKEIIGREHTGQLSTDDRIEREGHFREGKISSLFCSPTMELGIDVANLNIVHMRNVPPNPANYAQRSGRAGRSGQTALVFTYCSGMSPHDQNYFNNMSSMVSGSVIPPRIDLTNEDMLLTHLNAYLLMELRLGEINYSVVDALDLSDPSRVVVKPDLVLKINDLLANNKANWIATFHDSLSSIQHELNQTPWYTSSWTSKKLDGFTKRFESAFKRWIALYASAISMMNRAHNILTDPSYKDDNPIKRDAKRDYAVASRQLTLLKNESKKSSGNESEFYIFRYLASEGFLPGYNFTRLPVRTFVGHRSNNEGEFLSRPRKLALREYGAHNIIYHNGNKYRIGRMNVLDADAQQRRLKISNQTGYVFLDEEVDTANVDPITTLPLTGSNMEICGAVIEITDSEAAPLERISCIEEERSSASFEIDEYFHFPLGMAGTKSVVISNNGTELLRILFSSSTDLVYLNRKRRRSEQQGFSMDKRNGKWLFKRDVDAMDPNERAENKRDFMVFARDTADAIYIQPLASLGLNTEQCYSLCFAMKRGIERIFLVEENEIGVKVVGPEQNPNILIYEASEGTLGVLSNLIHDPIKMRSLFEQSYMAMHFDPLTRNNTPTGETLPKASYRDLLSYYNQIYHDLLDRYSIKDALELLMDCTVSAIQAGRNRDQQYDFLLLNYDKSSSTEKKFIDHLYKNGFALPERAQVKMPTFYCSADFVYESETTQVFIFCDGTVHDEPDQMIKDRDIRAKLRDQGIDFIVWRFDESLEDLMKKRPDVFRKMI